MALEIIAREPRQLITSGVFSPASVSSWDAPDKLIRNLTRAEQDLDGATVRVTRALRQLELFRD